MVIQIMSNLFDPGYVEEQNDCLLTPFFSGANVAFRKAAIEELGSYDLNCTTGEDQDICIRLASSRWELYSQPEAIVAHKSLSTVKAFAKQWYRYGRYQPYIFKKHSSNKLAVYRKATGKAKGTLYQRLLSLEHSPLRGIVFLTSFSLMHLVFLAALITVAFRLNTIPVVLAFIGCALAAVYVYRDIHLKRPATTCQLIALRYLANLALLVGGIRGGFKSAMLYIAPTLDRGAARN